MIGYPYSPRMMCKLGLAPRNLVRLLTWSRESTVAVLCYKISMERRRPVQQRRREGNMSEPCMGNREEEGRPASSKSVKYLSPPSSLFGF
jgi:hypothetical protein